LVLANSGNDGGEDGEDFVGFLEEEVDLVAGNVAVLVEELQPELALIRSSPSGLSEDSLSALRFIGFSAANPR
jgi:hypothetical protein